jgi:hypothetical protein
VSVAEYVSLQLQFQPFYWLLQAVCNMNIDKYARPADPDLAMEASRDLDGLWRTISIPYVFVERCQRTWEGNQRLLSYSCSETGVTLPGHLRS